MGCGHWYERSSSGEWQWGTETRCMLLCASLLDWIFGRSTTSEVKEATRTLYPNANTLPELFGPSACNPNMRSPKRINLHGTDLRMKVQLDRLLLNIQFKRFAQTGVEVITSRLGTHPIPHPPPLFG